MKLLTILFLASSVVGQWDYQGTQRRERIYFHRPTVERQDHTVRLWVKTVGRQTKKGYFAFDCTHRKVKQLQTTTRQGTGNAWDDFLFIEPGTRSEWLFKRACRY